MHRGGKVVVWAKQQMHVVRHNAVIEYVYAETRFYFGHISQKPDIIVLRKEQLFLVIPAIYDMVYALRIENSRYVSHNNSVLEQNAQITQ